MKKILLIEDSDDIGELVINGLTEHIVSRARSVSESKTLLSENEFDLVLIDVTLPDGNGFDLCLDLSRDLKYMEVPKIILTAKNDTSDKVYGFTCGAQDYVTKPFHILELKARIERYFPKSSDLLNGEFLRSRFAFNPGFHKCYLIDEDGSRVDLQLTPTEFRLFLTLVKAEGEALSRRQLEHSAWESQGASIQIRGVDTHIAHLRKKLGLLGSMIVSVYGQGYAFQNKTLQAPAV